MVLSVLAYQRVSSIPRRDEKKNKRSIEFRG
jgi:hypothetical protein